MSFLVQLHAQGLTVLRKRVSILDPFLWNLWSFTEFHFYRRQLDDCFWFPATLALLATADCLGLPQRVVRKRLTVFASKTFKITKVKWTIFCGWGRLNEQKRVFSRSSHPEVFFKKSALKYSAELTRKHLCRSLSLTFWR